MRKKCRTARGEFPLVCLSLMKCETFRAGEMPDNEPNRFIWEKSEHQKDLSAFNFLFPKNKSDLTTFNFRVEFNSYSC